MLLFQYLTIVEEYEAQTGEKLANNRIEGEEYMRSFEEVYMERDRYFSASENSKHIQKMVVQQHTKFSANYRGQTGAHQNFNRLFPARQPAKITNRRSTCAAPTHRLYVYFDYNPFYGFTVINKMLLQNSIERY